MINVTHLVPSIAGFNRSMFQHFFYEEALLDKGCSQTPQGWFDGKGRWLGKTDKDAVLRLAIGFQVKESNQYYMVQTMADVDQLGFDKVIAVGFNGVVIVGVYAPQT